MIGISRAPAEKEQGHSERVEMLLSILDGSTAKVSRGELPFPSANVLCDLADALRDLDPEVLHVHAPGQPHTGDVLGEALRDLPKIPVVQTNVYAPAGAKTCKHWRISPTHT